MNNGQRFSGEWSNKPLSDLAVVTMGQSPSSIFYNSRGEGLPLIQGNADIENRKTIERIWTSQGNKHCVSGDLILTVRAPVGAVAVASINACIGRGVCGLKPFGDSSFLFHALVYAEGQWQTLEQGSTFTAANSDQVEQFRIFVPDDENEQRAIAEVLSDVDGLINALEALIAKKRAIKQATMQQLLTGKTRLPGFSEEWETKRLGEIGEISGAGVNKKIIVNEESVRLVNYLDVYNKSFLYSKDLTHEVTARPDQIRRCAVERGDVFFTPSSEVPDDIGCSAVAMEDIPDGVYSYHVVRLRLKTNWDINFRAYIFNTKEFLDQASRQCDGSGTRYVISLPKFRDMTVRFPPTIEEQRTIAAVLSDMDAEIAALEQRRDKTIAIKQGMMQQLLTGKVRLSESLISTDDAD